MKLARHISSLLYENDKVIVPGLGCFYTVQESSRIRPGRQSIKPPLKSIEFDENKKQDDSLLTRYIIKSEDIPLKEARGIIADFVENSIKDLKDGKQIKLIDIGVLSLEPNGKIKFIAETSVNYDTKSYGMASIKATEVKRRKTDLQDDEPPKEKEPVLPPFTSKPPKPPPGKKTSIIEPEEKQPKKRKKISNWVWIGIALLPIVVFCLTLWIMNPDYIKRQYTNFSQKVFPPKKQITTMDIVPDTSFLSNDIDTTAQEIDTASTEDIETMAKEDSETTSPAEKSQQVTQASGNKFYLIIGSFINQSYANRLFNKMKAKNYNPKIIKKESMFLVSIKEYDTKQEAKKEFYRLKTDENITSWVYYK